MSTSSSASRVQANLKELFQANLAPGNAYIRFGLVAEVSQSSLYPPVKSSPKAGKLTSEMTFLLSMEQVQESLVVKAEKITPLPSMPKSVIGIMTTHNHVFCVFDLAQLLQLHSRSISPQQYQIIVLQTASEKPIYIGFSVTHLQGIVRLSPEKIQFSLDGFPDQITPYLFGVVQLEEAMIPILEFNLISEALTTLKNI